MTTQAEQPFYKRSSLPLRPPLSWPSGAHLALAVVVSVEYYEMQPPKGAFTPPNVGGLFGRAPYPDIGTFSRREYGNRVGIFRVMECLDRRGLVAAAAIDATTAEKCPQIAEECRRLKWEIAAHGKAVTQVISSQMSEWEERRYIAETISAVTTHAGTRPKGWHGAEFGESARTPALLAEQGMDYVLDWPNDEQPYRLSTPAGDLISIPTALELDDVYAIWQRRLAMDRWRDSVISATARLLRDGEQNGRLLVLNLHPWLIGQPYRASYLEEVLEHLAKQARIWFATPGEIADWYKRKSA